MELEGALLLRTDEGRRGESGGRIKGETLFANKSLGLTALTYSPCPKYAISHWSMQND